MKQLNKIENIIFLLGAILMVIGSGAYVLLQPWAPWMFTVGTVAFVIMQLKQTYDGNSLTIRRLRGIVIMSDIMFIITAVLMFANHSNFLGLSQINYVNYIHNNWVITMLIGAVLQLYTSYRLDSELKKEAKNHKRED